MELSLFLAKAFGIYLLIVAGLWLLFPRAVAESLGSMFRDRGAVVVSGLISLLAGVAMVVGHSVWEPNWRGLLTLFGYLAVAKGVIRIVWPDRVAALSASLLSSRWRVFWILLMATLGGYLAWIGYSG